MNPNTRQSAFLALSAAVAFLSPCTAFGAGAVKVDVTEKPKFDDIVSPEFTGVRGKPFKGKDWLEVEARIKVDMAPEPKNKTCDNLTVKWYIAVDNPDKPNTFLKLTKEIEYVNVPLKEDVYCSVYISPASIRRLTGFERSGKRAIKFVGFEVIVDGKVMASSTDKAGKDNWWTAASSSIAESTAVPLLNKMETPFAGIWWDRYAEIKSKTSP
ncbi:MAG: Amuc_1102 family pilus-like protein [Verrucomicrobiota bacterium]